MEWYSKTNPVLVSLSSYTNPLTRKEIFANV